MNESNRTNLPSLLALSSLPENIRRLVESVLRKPGASEPGIREKVMDRALAVSMGETGPEVPMESGKYLDKVSLWAYKVHVEEIDKLRESGYSDDKIFELTVVGSVGAGLARLGAGLIALEEAEKHESSHR